MSHAEVRSDKLQSDCLAILKWQKRRWDYAKKRFWDYLARCVTIYERRRQNKRWYDYITDPAKSNVCDKEVTIGNIYQWLYSGDWLSNRYLRFKRNKWHKKLESAIALYKGSLAHTLLALAERSIADHKQMTPKVMISANDAEWIKDMKIQMKEK